MNGASDEVVVAVVGAGPGGLGAAGLLTRAGHRTVLLERGPDVAWKWRNSYDRLRINTSTLTSYLPGMRFPRGTGLWPTRDALVSYYDCYVEKFGVEVRTGTDVKRVERDGNWHLTTSSGNIRSRAVVIATGRDGTPVIPEWPGRDRFRGVLIHAAQYRNAKPFAGLRVLVVGVGNSASDIAVDLAIGGARVAVALRTPPHVIRRSVLGVPNDLLQVATRRVPTKLVDAMAEGIRRRSYGDLERLGLGRPPVGVKTYVRTQARVPTIDSGQFSAAVRARSVEIVSGLVELTDRGVRLADGSTREVDAIVAATGYRPALEGLIGHLDVLDERGWPTWAPSIGHDEHPGLFTVGFGDPSRGNLRGLRLDARRVTREVGRLLERWA
jgi:cation diffusion facilitator CzcD-associated flavoprotein CzcO